MRTVVFDPGQQWPRIVDLVDIHAIRAAVGGYINAQPLHRADQDLMIITRCDAEAIGAPPNRIADGHCLYGVIVVCGDNMKSIPLPAAKELQSDCEWPMAHLEVYDKPA